MAIFFAILEQSRVILSFVFAAKLGTVRCIVICIYLYETSPISLLISLSNHRHCDSLAERRLCLP